MEKALPCDTERCLFQKTAERSTYMLRCAKCGKEAEFCFKVMKVETLRVRDITGEKRVQAVGAFEKICACRECAMERLVVVRKGVRLKKFCPIYASLHSVRYLPLCSGASMEPSGCLALRASLVG